MSIRLSVTCSIPRVSPLSDSSTLSGARWAAVFESSFERASGEEPNRYTLRLTNQADAPLTGFTLCVNGPIRVDGRAKIDGARVVKSLSNHIEIAPERGFGLAPGATWTVEVRGLRHNLQHWSDGATTAYLIMADGGAARVAVTPTRYHGDNRPLLRGTSGFAPQLGAPEPLSIIPWPQAVGVAGRRATPHGLSFDGQDDVSRAAATAFADLSGRLFPAEALARTEAEGGLPIHCVLDRVLAPEAYAIAFGPEAAQLRAADHAGFLYGMISLGQILRGARLHPQHFIFPLNGEIVDAPVHRWRGSHLDVARQFYAAEEVMHFVRVLAWNKLNRFHWHLSDDEAWRVEIDAYPELTSIGAWRGHGLAIPPVLGSGPEKYGGYYTKDVVRRVVAAADDLGVAVVPEIDIPGHSFAVLKALPWLSDPGEHGVYASVQVFPNNCLNPANERTFEFLDRVFDELVDLFPSKIIHIGADEVPLGAWSGSPMALEWLRGRAGEAAAAEHAARLNGVTNLHGADDIEGTGAAALQAHFLRRVQSMLAAKGCVTGGWEEAAHGDVVDKAATYLVGWRNVEACRRYASAGYDIVVSPGQRYYLDMSMSKDWHEPGAWWAGSSSPEETYAFDPSQGWTNDQKRRLMGVQACIWSEHMSDRAVFDRLVFPRLSAIAETGWTASERKSWPRFKSMAGLMPNMYGHWSR